MKISDIPEFRDKSEVLTFDESTPVRDAIKTMAEKNYGAVLVTKKDMLSGIFTERDLLKKIAAEGKDIGKLQLKDVMTPDPNTASIEDAVTDCMRRMSQGRFRHMPVVDDKGKILGLLSQGDFVAFTMSDIMARFSISAKAGIEEGRSTPYAIAAAILLYTIALIIAVSIF